MLLFANDPEKVLFFCTEKVSMRNKINTAEFSDQQHRAGFYIESVYFGEYTDFLTVKPSMVLRMLIAELINGRSGESPRHNGPMSNECDGEAHTFVSVHPLISIRSSDDGKMQRAFIN